MVPWETLRRLLGLPPDMERPEAVELVRIAVEQPRHARLIAMALRGLTPKEPPAAVVLAARERGALNGPRVAELLGCIGHAAGYDTVRAMLYSVDETDACAPAGVATARILGRRAEADLVIALSAAASREGREGAALGLCELGSAEAAVAIAEAGRAGKIRVRVAARCAARLPFDPDFWIERLESDEIEDRRYGTELVWELLRAGERVGARERLSQLGERGRSAVKRALSDPELFMLPEKRRALAEWAESG